MKSIPGYFIGIILLVLLALTGTSIITGSIRVTNARDFHASIISQIEASNFNENVISSLYQEADDNGYELEPIKVQVLSERKKMCEIILKYNYEIGILNIKKEQHEIRGYAR